MAYTIAISETEAELITKAGIPGLNGLFFDFEPANAMTLINMAQAVEADGVQTFTNRLATLHGQWLHERKQAGVTDDFHLIATPALPQDEGLGEQVRDMTDLLPIETVTEIKQAILDAMQDQEKPDEEGEEPAAAPAPSKRGRKSA